MNRTERRAALKRQRNDIVQITRQEKHEIAMKAQQVAWDNIFPIFLLYLIDHFHCKEKGIIKFLEWFNMIDEWCEGDAKKLKSLREEVQERAGIIIEHCMGRKDG